MERPEPFLEVLEWVPRPLWELRDLGLAEPIEGVEVVGALGLTGGSSGAEVTSKGTPWECVEEVGVGSMVQGAKRRIFPKHQKITKKTPKKS